MDAKESGRWPPRLPRRVHPARLLALAVLLGACNWAVVSFAFREPRRWAYPAWWLASRTGELVSLTLSANLIALAAFLLVAFRQQSPRDLGLDVGRLPAGLAGTLAVFATTVAAQAVAAVARGHPIAWNPAWSDWPRAAGDWLGQMLGNAPFEEVVYRGFYLPQAFLLAGRLGDKPRLAAALLLSQGLFAAIHLPINVAQGRPAVVLLVQFAAGLLLAGIYLRTGNLFLTIGLHALINAPPSPIAESFPSGVVAGLLAIGLLAWTPRRLRPSRRAGQF